MPTPTRVADIVPTWVPRIISVGVPVAVRPAAVAPVRVRPEGNAVPALWVRDAALVRPSTRPVGLVRPRPDPSEPGSMSIIADGSNMVSNTVFSFRMS